MHSRCETASLHAACTSLSEAHDDVRSLQTDMFFSRKSVVSQVAPTPDQLTNEIGHAGRLHDRLWCVLPFGNKNMERQNRPSFWKPKIQSLQTDLGMFSRKKDHPIEAASSVDLAQYFTRDFFAARPIIVPTAPGELRNSHRYGILTQKGQSHYFQVEDYESVDKDEKTLQNIGVKRCYDSITKPVVFNDKGPMNIEDWPYILIWPDMDVVYIRNPREYFHQSNLQTQNKWPIGKPNLDLPAAMRRTWPRTDASTNPYIVQRFGADTALDPEVSLQTNTWPRLRMPNVRQKKQNSEELSVGT